MFLKWMFVYYNCCIMIELTFMKEFMLIKQVHQKSAMFVTAGYIFKLYFWVSTKCMQDLLIMSINLSNIATLNIKGSNFPCIITLSNKNEAMKLLQNADLTGKSGTL